VAPSQKGFGDSRGNPRILADSAIASVAERAGVLGDVVTAPGPEITRARVRETRAQALLVRSVTRVDSELLAGTQVRFVATATAGVDHVDQAWLANHGITFAHAPGCNAPAVVHWVLTALMVAARGSRKWLPDGPIGVVGHGQVGGRLVRKLTGLGLTSLICDPPQALAKGAKGPKLVSLAQVLATCTIVTLHVPLTTPAQSAYPTAGLVHPGVGFSGCLINTSRGPVCTPEFVDQAAPNSLILDVWPREPHLPWVSLQRPESPVRIASPHVAGYSRASKERATQMVIEALAQYLGVSTPPLKRSGCLKPVADLDLAGCQSALDVCAAIVASTCALEGDNKRVRGLSSLPVGERAGGFEALRRGYNLREQPSSLRLTPELWRQIRPWREQAVFAGGPPLARVLDVLGFHRDELGAASRIL